MTAQVVPKTPEAIVSYAFEILKCAGLLDTQMNASTWRHFLEAERLIEKHFEVPWTTITPLMRRFLFALSASTRPRRIVGAGTYAGFAFAWIACGAAVGEGPEKLLEAVGLDIDPDATTLARANSAHLGLNDVLRFETADAAGWLRNLREPIDLLYIDIDEPDGRKRGYLDVLRAAQPHLAPGAFVMAHDPCVPLFADDFADFHSMIERDSCFIGPQVLPLDECGVSLSRVTP